jgi:hypothetical protein
LRRYHGHGNFQTERRFFLFSKRKKERERRTSFCALLKAKAIHCVCSLYPYSLLLGDIHKWILEAAKAQEKEGVKGDLRIIFTRT